MRRGFSRRKTRDAGRCEAKSRLVVHVRTGAYAYWLEYRSRSHVAKAGNGPLILFEGFRNGFREFETWVMDLTPVTAASIGFRE